jgi:hypothetical protein
MPVGSKSRIDTYPNESLTEIPRPSAWLLMSGAMPLYMTSAPARGSPTNGASWFAANRPPIKKIKTAGAVDGWCSILTPAGGGAGRVSHPPSSTMRYASSAVVV